MLSRGEALGVDILQHHEKEKLLGVKEFVGGKNNGFPFCFRYRTALLRSWELLSDPGAQKRNVPPPSDNGRVTFYVSNSIQAFPDFPVILLQPPQKNQLLNPGLHFPPSGPILSSNQSMEV